MEEPSTKGSGRFSSIKIVSIIDARPQFVKESIVQKEISKAIDFKQGLFGEADAAEKIIDILEEEL